MGILSGMKHKVLKVEKKIKEKPASYDFKEYSNIEDMRGYVGFITPQGTFYRVRKAGSANGSHPEWAFGYLYELGLKPNMLNINQNILELMLNPDFNFTVIMEARSTDNIPFYFAPGYKLTEEQKNVINDLSNGRLNEASLNQEQEMHQGR